MHGACISWVCSCFILYVEEFIAAIFVTRICRFPRVHLVQPSAKLPFWQRTCISTVIIIYFNSTGRYMYIICIIYILLRTKYKFLPSLYFLLKHVLHFNLSYFITSDHCAWNGIVLVDNHIDFQFDACPIIFVNSICVERERLVPGDKKQTNARRS